MLDFDDGGETELMTTTNSPEIDLENMPEDERAANDRAVPDKDPTPSSQPTKKELNLTPLQATVKLVERGHRELLPRLRAQLAAQPEIFRYVGDLGQQAQRAWVERIGGEGNDLLKESVVLYAEEMKEKLVGQSASRLEKLAAERIAAAWLETEYFRAWCAQHPEADGTTVGELYRKRHEAADRRLARALASLAMIKRLLPKTIEVQVIQKPVAAPSPAPIIGGVLNGDQPMVNGTPKPLNGVNRIGGKLNGHHNRLEGLLEPATVQ
jgi:hypothetical protein